MSTKHTPGPWHWVIQDHSCASLGVGDDPGHGTPLVMSVSPCRSCTDSARDGKWKWGRCTTPNEADAHLIAAAPEMLEALRLHKAWSDSERVGPDYGAQSRDTHPDGERIWRAWWNNQLDLCDRANRATDAALRKAEA